MAPMDVNGATLGVPLGATAGPTFGPEAPLAAEFEPPWVMDADLFVVAI